MSHDDFDFEPVPGLPAHLPEGEHMLWQGKPTWSGLANQVMHVKLVALYCAILLGWIVASGLYDGLGVFGVLQSLGVPVLIVTALFTILLGIAFGLARSTIYTITNRRVVMRFGIAMPITINLPFSKIETAALKRHADGTGDIPLALKGNDRLAWLHLWPHARPWRMSKPEPMLRSLQAADKVATLLADAMAKELPEGRVTLPQVAERQVNAATGRGLATA